MSVQSGYPSAQALVGDDADTWASPANALGGPNATYSRGQAGVTATTKQLHLTGLGLAVPTGSTFKGLKVTTSNKSVPGVGGTSIWISLVSAGVLVGEAKSFIDENSVAHSVVMGGINDDWGAGGGALTPAVLNAAGFGVVLWCADGSGDAGCAIDLDSALVEVFFAAPGETVSGTTPTGGNSTVAYGTNEQVSSASVAAKLRYEATSIQPKTFAAGSGTLAPLTPVAYNTSTNFWVPFANGGANGTGTIKGFVGPDPIVLAASNEVLGNVIMGGTIHLADIPIIAGYTLAQLKTALTGTVRALGYKIQGMEKWY